ncbi:MAG: peptidylprolyl isomerase [Candidatus Ratteibacteria bacterium]|nr:peptidylprolyl isomerase [Candidatus Ratteibacteria bacterium]
MIKLLKTLFFTILFQITFIINGSGEVIDYIAAIVDKEVITASELKERLAVAIEYYNKIYTGEELEKRLGQIKKTILTEAIEEKVLLISADRANIEVTEEEIEKNLEELEKEFSTPDEFYAQLKRERLTIDDLKEKTKTRIKTSKFVRLNILRDIRIAEEEITNFYEENKNSFLMPEQVKISQILIKSAGNNEAEKTAEEIFKKLKSGEDFSSLAKLYSEGPNASAGGDLGFVYLEQLQPQIRQAISELKVGEFTKPTLISGSYNIIKLEAKKLSQYAPITEVSELIKKRIYDSKVERAYENWMNDAKKDFEIVTFSPLS